MSIYIDADAFARWEKGEFDLLAWIEETLRHAGGFSSDRLATSCFWAFAWQPRTGCKADAFAAEFWGIYL